MTPDLPRLPVDPPPPREPGLWQIEADFIKRGRRHAVADREPSAAEFDRLDALAEKLAEECVPRAQRREIETALAQYIAGPVYALAGDPELLELADRLRRCRRGGAVGVHAHGHMVCWDEKCGESKLCPDESHAETQRLTARYLPAILAWQAGAAPGWRRVHKAVLTIPNVPLGGLADAHRAIFARLKSHLLKAREKIPAEERRRRDRKRTRDVFPGIKGALAVMENPLGADGRTWNVHLNVLLLVEGAFDYGRLRAAWGYQLDIYPVKGGPVGLGDALRESIKYMACAVSEKSTDHADAGRTRAPGMTDWSPAAWLEWWSASKRSRRTRSYGLLYSIGEPDADRIDMESVQWVAAIDWQAGRYWVQLAGHARRLGVGVDLIQGDKSAASRGGKSARRGSQGWLQWWARSDGGGGTWQTN